MASPETNILNVSGSEDTKREVGSVLRELAKEYNIDLLYDKYSKYFAAAVSVAFGVASQALRRFGRVLKSLGSKSIEGLEAFSPLAGTAAKKIVSMFAGTGGSLSDVTAQTLGFIKDSWITRTIAVLFIFRYVYNHCIGIDDSDIDELQTETESIFSAIISKVTPGPIASVVRFCINSMVAAMRFALLPIRVALGPVVEVCRGLATRVERREQQAMKEQQKELKLADSRAALEMQENSAAAADLLRTEQRAQVTHLMELQRLQQEHKAQQRRQWMKDSAEKNRARIEMEEEQRRYRKALDQGKKERARREAAEKRVGALDYLNVGPLTVPLPGFIGSLFAPPRNELEQEIYDQEQARRAKAVAGYRNYETYYKKPEEFDTGENTAVALPAGGSPAGSASSTFKRTAPAPGRTLSVASRILSPGVELQHTAWRQTKRLAHLRPLSI